MFSKTILRNLRNLNFTKQMSYYAVARGFEIGVFDTWAKCEKSTKGYKNAKYKKFRSAAEAEAFVKNCGEASTSQLKMNSYNPKDFAVAVRKRIPGQWDEEVESKKQKLNEKSVTEGFWPECDGDNCDDEYLLTAMLEVEGILHNQDKTHSRTGFVQPKHTSKIWEPVAIKKIGTYDFLVDEEGFVIVYTDGSCKNNGTSKAIAGFGVYFDDDHPLNAAKPVTGRVTNNVGEIQAAIYAIKVAKDLGIEKLCISTDSQFLINSITSWIHAWKRHNWRLKNKQPVKNVVDFKELDELLQDDTLAIKWNYVSAHTGIKGNERADGLARAGADKYKFKLQNKAV